MLSIGAFARLCGLPSKTLRHYHDLGLLVPARVDAATGYRGYDPAQVEAAVKIRVLRGGGMPLASIREVLDSPDRAAALVEEFHASLRRRREREERALAGAAQALSGAGGAVRERRAPRTRYASVAIPLETDAETGSPSPGVDARVDAAAGDLRQRLAKAGAEPAGPLWTGLAPSGGGLEVRVCAPLPEGPFAVEPSSGGPEIRTAELPERREAFIEVPLPDQPGDETVQLALAALLSQPGEHRPN